MFDRILIPLDGSANSEKIRYWVADLAVAMESPVDLLAVIDLSKLHLPQRSSTDAVADAQLVEQAAKEDVEFARAYLRKQSDWFRERGVTVAIHVVTGDPSEAIIAQSYELDARLIAMSTSRRSALARGILGSVADRILHAAGIPVMLVRPGDEPGFSDEGGLPGTVIVPVDGSSFSEGAVPYAEALASRSSGRVIFVNGRPPNSSYAAFAMTELAKVEQQEASEPGQKGRLESYLEGLVGRSTHRGVDAELRRSHKTAADAIIEVTSESRDRIVVMTSHGASGVRRWLLGSVADTVIRSAEHPVIVIPPEHQQVSYRGQKARKP